MLLISVLGIAVLLGCITILPRFMSIKEVDKNINTSDSYKATIHHKEVSNVNMELIKKFSKTVQLHKKLGHEESYDSGIKLLGNIIEMIERVSIDTQYNDAVSHLTLQALTKYGSMIQKIDTLYGESVFLDIQRNPHLWKNGEETIVKIIKAVNDVNDSVIEDIIKFNETKALDIRIALAVIDENTDKREAAIENIFNNSFGSSNQLLVIENNIEKISDVDVVYEKNLTKNTLKKST